MGREIAIAGYARIAEGTASRALYDALTLSAIIDVETNTILKAGSTIVSDVGSAWVRDQLVGVDITVNPSPFVHTVERDYWGLSAPAIIQAFRDMARRYQQNLERERQATRA